MAAEIPTIKPRANPGTDEAIKAGCRCPVIDNGRGRGWMGQPGIFVFSADCPVHVKVVSYV